MKATPTMKLFIVFFLVCLTTQIWATTVFAPTRPTASLDSEYMGVQENNAGRAIYRSPKERDETQKPMVSLNIISDGALLETNKQLWHRFPAMTLC